VRKSEERAWGASKTTIVEIKDKSWEEERTCQKTNSHILFHINDKESADTDVVKEIIMLMKHPTMPSDKSARKVTIEEVEDKALEAHRKKPKSSKHLLEALDNLNSHQTLPSTSVEDMTITPDWSGQRQAFDAETRINEQDMPETQIPEIPLPPPPKDQPYHLQKKHFTPAGTSALRVLVLSTRGWVGSLENGAVDLWLDSCTDVTLISEDFFKSLKGAQRERQGMRMQLWQLTDKDSSLKGFVHIPILMQSEEGVTCVRGHCKHSRDESSCYSCLLI